MSGIDRNVLIRECKEQLSNVHRMIRYLSKNPLHNDHCLYEVLGDLDSVIIGFNEWNKEGGDKNV